jgi:hypothetical protein
VEGTPPTPRNAFEHSHAESGHGGDAATVMTVDPVRQTATVYGGRDEAAAGVPWLGMVGPDGEGWFGSPSPGWRAITGKRMGTDAIEGFAPGPTLFKSGTPERDDYADEVNTHLSLTGTPRIYHPGGDPGKNFRSHRPGDVLSGDMGFRSAEGAMVYAGRGGVAGIKVSDLCQLVLNQVDDLVRLVSRNLDVFSDWGEIQHVNEGGKTRMVIRGNAKASNTYAGTFDFEASIGDGDSFIDVKLSGPNGAVYTMKTDQKGNQHIMLKADKVEQVMGHHALAVTKDQRTIIGGRQEVDVDVDYLLNCPHVHLGGQGGQPAPMGNDLVAYLKALVFWMNNQLMVMSPAGPTTPGCIFPAPAVPDLLSKTVDYVK